MTQFGNPTLNTLLNSYRRLDAVWETRLQLWERPASTSEEKQIQRAARMVRDAISSNNWLSAEGVTVEAQGSYFNNTNVRTEADMDLRVVHPSVRVVVDRSINAANDHADSNYIPTGRTNRDVARELRWHVEEALGSTFGKGNVDASGTKAFRISAVEGSRSDIDIVPALGLDYITLCQGQTLLSPNFIGPIRGVAIFGTDGREIINFPAHHHRYGINKRFRTGFVFKKVVRQLKSMRDSLVDKGVLSSQDCPSFFIECLVYRVEDQYFNIKEGRRLRLKRILNRCLEQVSDPNWCASALEINDHKLLFGVHQAWTPRSAINFAVYALAELDRV